MTQPHRLLNPTTGEVKLCSATEARRLRAYGWRSATLAEWNAYRNALAELGLAVRRGTLVRH